MGAAPASSAPLGSKAIFSSNLRSPKPYRKEIFGKKVFPISDFLFCYQSKAEDKCR